MSLPFVSATFYSHIRHSLISGPTSYPDVFLTPLVQTHILTFTFTIFYPDIFLTPLVISYPDLHLYNYISWCFTDLMTKSFLYVQPHDVCTTSSACISSFLTLVNSRFLVFSWSHDLIVLFVIIALCMEDLMNTSLSFLCARFVCASLWLTSICNFMSWHPLVQFDIPMFFWPHELIILCVQLPLHLYFVCANGSIGTISNPNVFRISNKWIWG